MDIAWSRSFTAGGIGGGPLAGREGSGSGGAGLPVVDLAGARSGPEVRPFPLPCPGCSVSDIPLGLKLVAVGVTYPQAEP